MYFEFFFLTHLVRKSFNLQVEYNNLNFVTTVKTLHIYLATKRIQSQKVYGEGSRNLTSIPLQLFKLKSLSYIINLSSYLIM